MSKKFHITVSKKENEYSDNNTSYVYNLLINDKVIQSIHFICGGYNSGEMHILYIEGEKDLSHIGKKFLKNHKCKRCITPNTNEELKELDFKKYGKYLKGEEKGKKMETNCKQCRNHNNCYLANDAKAETICPDGAYNYPGRACKLFFLEFPQYANPCLFCANINICKDKNSDELICFEHKTCNNCSKDCELKVTLKNKHVKCGCDNGEEK